jgi:hypothetical protein
MDGRYVEPRKVMWAVAEISWQDAAGTSFRAPATLEDTSPSGACIRIRQPFPVGSRLTVKWHREQFSAVARNCRSDGRDFILGVRREAEGPRASRESHHKTATETKPLADKPAERGGVGVAAVVAQKPNSIQSEPTRPDVVLPNPERTSGRSQPAATAQRREPRPEFRRATESPPPARPQSKSSGTSSYSERKVMQPKTLFPQFWRRQQDGDAPAKSTSTEAPVNKPTTHAEAASGPRGDLLPYEDIYRAAGIMSPGSGYGIHKVVEMLNSERIRDLSKDVKRASVLMALDAATISVDELLTDATRRQNALNSYETAQKKQLEDFETRKSKENARIEEEIEKIRAHYAQRIQNNLDQVAKEKDALRNWQNAMQHESQRIAEVIELCGKQPAPPRPNALAVAAGAQGSAEKTPLA